MLEAEKFKTWGFCVKPSILHLPDTIPLILAIVVCFFTSPTNMRPVTFCAKLLWYVVVWDIAIMWPSLISRLYKFLGDFYRVNYDVKRTYGPWLVMAGWLKIYFLQVHGTYHLETPSPYLLFLSRFCHWRFGVQRLRSFIGSGTIYPPIFYFKGDPHRKRLGMMDQLT